MDEEQSVSFAHDENPKKDEVLSFNAKGRKLHLSNVADEFRLMQEILAKELTPEIAARVCEKSGSHLIKLVSPRVDGDHATLRINDPNSKRRSQLLPSTNAPDIPFCKVLFRPLEVEGYAVMSVVDHILNPESHSAQVLGDFSSVFGEDVLAAMQAVLLSPPRAPTNLGAGEFPIIFIPRSGGGDLQITPVSPVSTFMGIKRVTDYYFQRASPDTPRPPRGRWIRQAVSSKPQNISGAIGGPRMRFFATLPPIMQQSEAELFRFIHGGGFPRWRDDEVADWVLRYADKLDADANYNNQNTRSALDAMADRLIRETYAFISETLGDAKKMAEDKGMSVDQLAAAPSTPQVLIRRFWGKEPNFDRAKNAVTSPHFENRLRKSRLVLEEAI